ncbi:WD40-repeat-containing domain protein [Hygrophoropsis aurantiaca]|uniref:WD40-repeat-containing domain protein n=1 Tax=Hygrophoropsis aurantiaca TaxID=72124 RepID=A0ACB7ZVA1_9AGAM|nr:WD40-repeat-containing domain protein [Hygrophoropsis aurantiaca]
MASSASPGPADLAARLQPTKVFEGHTEYVWSVACFNDGKRVISGSRERTVRIWDVESEKQVGESLMHDFQVQSMALSPDERRLVSGGKGVVLWDLECRTVVWKKEEEEVDGERVAYSPDGQLIAAMHKKAMIVLLNAKTGEQIRQPLQFGQMLRLQVGQLPSGENVRCLGFSPDGNQLAVGSPSGTVHVFDVTTGKSIFAPFQAHTEGVSSLVYTFDGQQFITASYDKSIRVWDAATGQETGDPMLGHKDWVRRIVLSHDGQQLASSSDDATVRIWDLKIRQQIGGPIHSRDKHSFTSVAWLPDGRSIVTGDSDGKIFLWDDPPLDDHTVIPQAPAPTTSSPPVLSTSQSRANSISSTILNLPAGSSLTPANTSPDEDDDQWEYSTNESFDSVLDAPADVTQSTQRRKKRRRRGTPVTSSSPAAAPAVPNTLANAEPKSHLPQRQTPPPSENIAADTPADAATVTSASRFGLLTRFWKKMTATTARWTRKPPSKNINEPGTQLPGNHGEMQQSQGDAGENLSELRQVNNSLPRKWRWDYGRRNEEIGMIAPAPAYDRNHAAAEEYRYDPQDPPLIDRILCCMICCGVPKDDTSYVNTTSLSSLVTDLKFSDTHLHSH